MAETNSSIELVALGQCPKVDTIDGVELQSTNVFGTTDVLRSRRQRAIASVMFATFNIIIIIAGVLIVCLTAPKPKHKPCSLTFVSAAGNSKGYYTSPMAVAVGDFNNDTWPDIAVANSGIDSIGVFLGYGNGTFTSQAIYSTGPNSHPVSIAVGDFNSDYWLDIVVGNYDTNSISVLLGHGNGTFANQIAFSIGASRPKSIAVGDFNNDGHLDVVVANYGTSSVGILLGYGNGTLGIPATYSLDYSSPYSITVGDFNNDHQLDVAVANYDTYRVAVLLGYKNGTFASPMTFATGLLSYPSAVATGDFNNDNLLDIVTANSGTDNVGVFLGYGNGSFENQRTFFISVGCMPSYLGVADFNQDGDLDIAVSCTGSYNVTVLIGHGNGTFTTVTQHSILSQSNPFGIAVGDFNKDNQSDLVVASAETENIIVLTGYSTMPSKNHNTYSTGHGASSYQVVVADFNNDKRPDLAVVNRGTNNVGIFLGNGDGSFATQTIYSTGDQSVPSSLAIGDIDNDNQLDIVVADTESGNFGVLLGYGNGTFTNVRLYFLGELSSPYPVAVGDFNNDNQLDIVIGNYGPNSLTLVPGDGNGTFGNVTVFTAGNGSRPYSIAVGDFNNDSNLDLVVANFGANSVGVHLGYGNGTFRVLVTFSTGYASYPAYVCVGDLNRDNFLDIIVANSNANNIGVFLGYGNGSFATQITYSTGDGSAPVGLAVGDMNNDGYLDIVVANSYLDNVGVFIGYGDGTFASQIIFPIGDYSTPYSVAISDFNNDNHLDIVSANRATNNVAILLGHPATDVINQRFYKTGSASRTDFDTTHNLNDGYQGNHTVTRENINGIPVLLLGNYYSDFQTETSYSTGSGLHPFSVAVGDLNNDTHLDIVVANSGNGSVGIIFGYGNGSFESEINYLIGPNATPQQVIITDFNHDDQVDIIVTDSTGDNVIIYLGFGNGTFAIDTTIFTGSGSNPNSLADGDFNNDSILDLVVTNQGTDSIGIMLGFNYSAFENKAIYSTGDISSPTCAAIGDVNNDNQLDIVISNYGTQNVGVFLGYGDGTFAPQITCENVTGSIPWGIALGDFDNDNYLDIVTANWGLNNIGVLLGYGNGSFGSPSFYSAGFASRPVAVSVGDLNNDNNSDIVVTQYGSNSVGVFFGYGNGTFDNVKTYSTGNLSGPASGTVYDLNNDSYMDILTANSVSNSVGILFGYGNGSFADIKTYASGAGSAPQYAVAADFNNDTILDIAVALFDKGDVGIFFGYDNGSFSSMMTYTTGSDSGIQNLNFGDFNNDHHLDIAIVNMYSGQVGILFGYGNGYFTSIVLYVNNPSDAPYWIVVGDLNVDSRLDFAFIDIDNNKFWVFLGSGINHLGSQTTLLTSAGLQPSSITVGDFNNDKCLDVAVANYGTDNIGILFGYGDGTFGSMTTYSTGNGSQPSAIVVGDINNDTLLDILVANSGTDNVGIFLGYPNGTFAALTTYPTETGSHPVSIALGDFNGDQWLDIAVANFGSNMVGVFQGYGNGTFASQTKYSIVYGAHPNWVAFGNFTNSSWMDIVVANYDTDSVLVLLEIC